MLVLQTSPSSPLSPPPSPTRPRLTSTPLTHPQPQTLLGLQSRFGDNWRQITYNLSGLSPKRDWSSKRVNLEKVW